MDLLTRAWAAMAARHCSRPTVAVDWVCETNVLQPGSKAIHWEPLRLNRVAVVAVFAIASSTPLCWAVSKVATLDVARAKIMLPANRVANLPHLADVVMRHRAYLFHILD
jgi:hypothetical protein